MYVVNALIDMYAKCGSLKDACSVFEKLPKPGIVTWSAMIAEYVQHGERQEALQLYQGMLQQGMERDNVTLSSILKACSSLAALDQGKMVHTHFIESGLEADIFVENTLIDMYAKCGSLEDVHTLFGKLIDRDVVTWSAMISGYAQHGHSQQALQLFEQMQYEGYTKGRLCKSKSREQDFNLPGDHEWCWLVP